MDATETNTGTSWDDNTNQQEPSDFNRSDTRTSQTAPSFSYRSYPGTPALARNGTTSTFDHTVNVTLRLHWNSNSYGAPDLPPRMIAVQLRGSVGGYYDLAPDDFTGGGGSLTGTTGLEDKPASSSQTTGANPTRTVELDGTLVKICPNPQRSVDLTVGPFVLNHKGDIKSAFRTTVYSYGGSDYPYTTYSDARVYADFELDGDLRDVALSPSPDQLALDDGSTRTDPLNQYLINEGIPTSITLSSGSPEAIEFLRTHSSWSLTGTTPALRPLLPNYKEQGAYSAKVGPQHPGLGNPFAPNPTPTPERGLKFDVRIPNTLPSNASDDGWKFPVDNSKFGEKTLNHNVGGTTIPAPVALFFPSEGYQHPKGGPKGYHVYEDSAGVEHELPINTPNWFYYYQLAWTPPCAIVYWNKPFSKYVLGDTKIYIGAPAHADGAGYGQRPLFETVSGAVTWVGFYQAYGIDNFARVTTHEFSHKQNWETYHASIAAATGMANGIPDNQKGADGKMLDPDADPDNDGLPSGFEESIGLDPQDPDSTSFTAGGGYGGDQEAFVRWKENQVATPNRNVDWADNGLNFGRTPGGLPQNRIKRYKRDQVTPLP